MQYNGKERNIKNVVFDSLQHFKDSQNFDGARQNFIDPGNPRQPRQNLDPGHPRYPRQNFDPQISFNPRQNFMKPHHPRTHATHATECYLTDFILFWFL